jgi:hypothetical protein
MLLVVWGMFNQSVTLLQQMFSQHVKWSFLVYIV